MSREKYVYNPSTLQYEKVKTTARQRMLTMVGYAVAVGFTSLVLFAMAYLYFPTPKEKSLQRDIAQMKYNFENLADQYQDLTSEIDKIQSKDAEVHRVVFGMDPIDEAVWNGGTGGREEIVRLRNNPDINQLLSATLDKVEKLKHKVRIQNESLTELVDVANMHEDRLASIPSIKPVQGDKLKRQVKLLSGFGMRIHPVHKIRKLHEGIDFTAPKGTPIQATGNGVVTKVENKKTGYGKSVMIDHGYGFVTLYAHLEDAVVKVGQRVVKGEKIGIVGSTGTSTAPHCHYEVRVNGRAVNPIDYVLDGLTPEEYQDLIATAQEENQSFD